jgi:hypothetical protein
MDAESEVNVDFTEQQLQLIDRLAAEWDLPRELVVARGLAEFLSEQKDIAPSG